MIYEKLIKTLFYSGKLFKEKLERKHLILRNEKAMIAGGLKISISMSVTTFS